LAIAADTSRKQVRRRRTYLRHLITFLFYFA